VRVISSALNVYETALRITKEVTGGHAIDARAMDPVTYIRDHTSGNGVRFVFDTVCSADTQRQGLAVLGNQGILVNMATKKLNISLD